MLHTRPHRKYQSVLHNSLFCTHQNVLLAQGELEAEGRLKRKVVLDLWFNRSCGPCRKRPAMFTSLHYSTNQENMDQNWVLVSSMRCRRDAMRQRKESEVAPLLPQRFFQTANPIYVNAFVPPHLWGTSDYVLQAFLNTARRKN